MTILFEDARAADFGPLAALRHVGDLRCGAFQFRERLDITALWGRDTPTQWSAEQAGLAANEAGQATQQLRHASVLWSGNESLEPDTLGVVEEESRGEVVVAAHLASQRITPQAVLAGDWPDLPRVKLNVPLLRYPWDLVLRNGEQLTADVQPNATPSSLDGLRNVTLIGDGLECRGTVTIDPGVVLDTRPGPIRLDDGVRIKANATIEGPVCIGANSLVQHHAQIHDGVTLGPWCKAGGEIEASIVQGYTNKQHLGFLGHSYLGEWINLGAGCTTSDLKNTYGEIAVPLHAADTPVRTGSQFVGLTCGDYAKLGINTAVPTGAVVGVGSNVMGTSVPKFTGPMQWVVDGQAQPFDREKAVVIADRMMQRRKRTMTPVLESLLRAV